MTEEELKAALYQPPPAFAGRAIEVALEAPELACRVAHAVLEEATTAVLAGEPADLEFGPIYAAYLLGYHRDAGAFDRLVEIARLPGEAGDDLFGDAVTEDMCAILWAVCASDSGGLLSLIDDPAVGTYWRSAATRAITIGIAEGVLDRIEMLGVFQQRLEALIAAGQRTGDALDCATWLTSAIVALGVGDAEPLLDRAWEGHWIDGMMIGPEAWRERRPASHEEAVERIRRRDGWRYPVDPLGLRRWACFSEPRPGRSGRRGPTAMKDAARAKAKAQRKASRKTRRKNRKGKR